MTTKWDQKSQKKIDIYVFSGTLMCALQITNWHWTAFIDLLCHKSEVEWKVPVSKQTISPIVALIVKSRHVKFSTEKPLQIQLMSVFIPR